MKAVERAGGRTGGRGKGGWSGSDAAIEETRSLFRIGAVVDVNGLTAAFVAASLGDKTPYTIIPTPEGDLAIDESGAALEVWPPHPLRCSCA